MHKMCSDERKCAVMKGCLCSDELRRKKWFTEYLLLREHKEGIETCKTACGYCIRVKQHVGMHRRGVKGCNNDVKKGDDYKNVKKGDDEKKKKKKKRSSEFLRGKIYKIFG